jgi:hypothetical protein
VHDSALLQPPWEARSQLVKTMKNMFTGHIPATEDLSKHAGDFFGDKADHPSKHGYVDQSGAQCAVIHGSLRQFRAHLASAHDQVDACRNPYLVEDEIAERKRVAAETATMPNKV